MKLRALKGQRTKLRNALQEELKKVDGLSLQEAAAGDGLEFLVTTNLLKNLSEKLEDLNSEILQHPDVGDEDPEGEIQFATDFDLRLRAAIAKVQSLAQANASSHEYSLPQYASTSTPKVAKSVQYLCLTRTTQGSRRKRRGSWRNFDRCHGCRRRTTLRASGACSPWS